MITISVKKNLITNAGPMQLNVDIELGDHELITLFGPSGAGKTTILRMIAGLTTPDEGKIQVGGETWFDSDKRINLAVQERQIGFVSQEYNLFPNMSVAENLQYALSSKKDESPIHELLELMHLTGLRDRKPGVLSGGQRQRVALARAILRQPKIFLLDEPLSALDRDLRMNLQNEILQIHQRFKIPTIFVTHELGEIFKISEKIFVLEEGRIVRSGKPGEVFGEDSLSGKFKFVGTILEIKQEDVIFIVTIQIGQNVTKVVATAEEVKEMSVGDKVVVAAKAFNPIILRV